MGKSVPDNCQHHTVRRAFRNKPLTDTDKNINRHIAKVRCRVEHVFGFIENSMKGSTFRGIGMDGAKTNVTLTNLLYNIFRFEQIKRLGLKSWASCAQNLGNSLSKTHKQKFTRNKTVD